MNRYVLGMLCCVIGGAVAPVNAEDTLVQWAENYEKPEIQQKILNLIFSGQVGPLSSATKDPNGTYFFPKNSQWVRLGGSVISSPGSVAASGAVKAYPYLIVTCMLYKFPDREPVNAASYVLRDSYSRPTAISAGYASHEELSKLTFPKLGKTFLLLTTSSSGKGGGAQWSSSLLEIGSSGPRDTPKAVWLSPPALRSFQMGIDALGSEKEYIILRVPLNSGRKGEYRYLAYRWNGSRFEADNNVFESRLKTLPEDAWKYGASQ